VVEEMHNKDWMGGAFSTYICACISGIKTLFRKSEIFSGTIMFIGISGKYVLRA
jgi:hypothetical protein